MNYHQTDEYPIDLNDVFNMIGFVNKANAKKTLKNNFTEGSDYQISLVRSEKRVYGGSSPEKIMMNVDTFKNMCMIARTEKGQRTETMPPLGASSQENKTNIVFFSKIKFFDFTQSII